MLPSRSNTPWADGLVRGTRFIISRFDLSHMHVGGSACDNERRDACVCFHVGSRLDI